MGETGNKNKIWSVSCSVISAYSFKKYWGNVDKKFTVDYK